MDDRPNPFKPGAGRVPPELAGRDDIIFDVNRILSAVRSSGEGERPMIFSGLRGVGKTVLLNHFARLARDQKWTVIKLEATVGTELAPALAKELHVELRRSAALSERFREQFKNALRIVRSFQLKVDPAGSYSFGFEVDPLAGLADSGDLTTDIAELLQSLGEAARSADSGILLAIDELQDAPSSDLNALNVALHRLGQSDFPVPVVFIGTGLPSLPAVLADATSYAERLYDYRTIGLLSQSDTESALVKPAASNGVSWEADALSMATSASGGYPYFVQACGKHVWDVFAGPQTITAEDAQIGIVRARDEVDQGLYQSRWDRATPAQREMMLAMAQDNGQDSLIGDLVQRTGKRRTSDLSVSRRELIRAGHIYAPDRGYLAFTVPGMADFINRTVKET